MENLIVACKKEEMWARKALYERYAPAMLSLCARYTGNREAARDVLQDGFFKVFTKISEYRGDGSFEGWLKKVFVNTALESLRRYRFVPLDDEHENTLIDSEFSAFEKLTADDLHRIIAELPAGCREVFNLHAVDGYSFVEIAKMLDIKDVTARTQYAYAQKLLRKKINVI